VSQPTDEAKDHEKQSPVADAKVDEKPTTVTPPKSNDEEIIE
jgi:hypothetical protein